jgi:hypothetical protein
LQELQELQEFRSSGVQEFRSSGVQEFRSSGVQEFRTGDSALEHVDKKSQGNWSVETVMHPLP